VAVGPTPRVNLLDDLAAFLQEHKRCDLLDSEVTRGEGECRVTFECECGAVISRTVEAELVDLRVDVIVTVGPYALEAAQNATTTIPIVFAGVGANFAPSRAGPNLTGVAEELIESTVKRLALLKEAVPRLRRVAILANPNNYGTQAYLQQCGAWAQAAGVTLQVYEVRDPDDIVPAFARMVSEHAEGLLAFTDSISFGQREKIVQTALRMVWQEAIPIANGLRLGVCCLTDRISRRFC
jgi:ABC-type uncharacterized transport system substrate-binding protein